MDARALGVLDGFPALLDVSRDGARQPGDGWSVDLARDALHGGEILGTGRREPGFDDVHPQARQLLGHLDLLRRSQREPQRLLPVAEGRIEERYVVGHGSYPVVVVRPCLFISARRSLPVFSIASRAASSRYFVKFGRPSSFSSSQRCANVPS